MTSAHPIPTCKDPTCRSSQLAQTSLPSQDRHAGHALVVGVRRRVLQTKASYSGITSEEVRLAASMQSVSLAGRCLGSSQTRSAETSVSACRGSPGGRIAVALPASGRGRENTQVSRSGIWIRKGRELEVEVCRDTRRAFLPSTFVSTTSAVVSGP